MFFYGGLCLLNIKIKYYYYKKIFIVMGIFFGNKILFSFIIFFVGYIWDFREIIELEI